MSWLARSFTNSLRIDDDGVERTGSENDAVPAPPHDPPAASPSYPLLKLRIDRLGPRTQPPGIGGGQEEPPSRGVKEDLSEFGETLTRQFWGVANFLAPPPTPPPLPGPDACHFRPSDRLDQSASEDGDAEPSNRDGGDDEGVISGLRSDFAEIGGRFRRMASNLMSIGSEEEMEERKMRGGDGLTGGVGMRGRRYTVVDDDDLGGDEAIGITEEVLAFALNIARHPETWLDFPLEAEDDLDDFEMSDAQQKHAMAIERLAPRLAALRIELCPCHMNESYFWKVYFVLLHSRLNKHDAEILSTPQVAEARAMWMQELQKKTKSEPEWFGSTPRLKDGADELGSDNDLCSPGIFDSENRTWRSYSYEPTTNMNYETDKHPIECNETQIIDKSVIEEKPVVRTENKSFSVGLSSKYLLQNFDDDEDDWPEEDTDLGGYSRTIPLGNEDDISFSDLEGDDDVGQIVSKGHKV